MNGLFQDLQFGLRVLARNPGFTTVAVLTLALGIGANTAIFSVLNAALLRPLPYPQSDRLVWITEVNPLLKMEVAWVANYLDWRDQSQCLVRMTAYDVSPSFNLTGRGTPARVRAARVTASFFATLGVNPQLGRSFTADEDQPNGAKVVTLMHSFWQQYFGSDPQVLGQAITLDATPYTVVGVMPSSFRFPSGSEVQILVASEQQSLTRIIGRLKPGVSVARVQAELSAIEKRADPNIEVKVVPLAAHLSGNLRPAIVTLMAVAGLVLLIACANVANLMLARASARTREIAVRAALGAGRGRLARQLLVESCTLAIAGGVAGLLLAAWGVKVMTRLIPASIGAAILNLTRPRVDLYVLLFSLGISVATGILFGLAPAIAGTRIDLAERLKDGVSASPAGPRRGMLRGVLVVAELSLALVLLIGAGLLVKSFYRVLSIDPGFAPERVLTMRFSLADSRYANDEQRRAFFSEVLRRVESLPGARSAALSDSLPLSPYTTRILTPREFDRDGGLPRSPNSAVFMYQTAVSPSYFYTLGIQVLRGRTFTDRDNEQSSEVAVVNETLARVMWPGGDPVGKELPVAGGKFLRVVGVVGDTRHETLSGDVESEVYVPYLQERIVSMQLAVRSIADPASLTSAVRGQVAAVDPEQPITQVATLEQTLSESVALRRFTMLLVGIFAAIALALAIVGIYGVMAFSVTQRTHEIGVRMALGADRSDVLRLVVRQGLRLTLAGVAFGIAGAWALTRLLTSFLFGVRPTDPATFATVSIILMAVSVLASYIPARRATKVDPMVALRYE
jgi:putative ABC transport system permease protein